MLGHQNSTSMQKQLDASMPWIGMYVALASLACSLAMAVDVFHGFQSKKLWFPSQYFPLNATSLTLLAVALKLPVDLTTNMWAATDRLAKLSSLALMTTGMAIFMPSLGSMTNKEILINVTALGILIITAIVDVCIQVVEMRAILDHCILFPEEVVAMSLMLLLLLVLGSSAIMVPTTKRFLVAKYQEMHDEASRQELSNMGEVTADKLRNLVKKYWVMAETSCPQFVIARSAASATSGVICLVNALILGQAIVRTGVAHKSLSLTASSYGCSTKWILLAQTIGVIVGTIATSFRWCTAIRFRCSTAADRSLKDEFKVEDYWTRKLKEYKGSPISSRIRQHKFRRLLYNARGVSINFVVRAQILIVLFNKLVLVISFFIRGPIKFIKHLKKQPNVDSIPTHVDRESESGCFKPSALRLEGAAELPDNTLKSICKEVDGAMRKGRRQQPSSLLQLLQKSCNFKGVAEFDSDQVPSIHRREPRNCWSLPVITLTCIAIALPNIAKNRIDQLLSDVRDGLFFVKIIEESFYQNGEWKNIRKAADIWWGVDLFRKWQELNLCEISRTSSNSKQALEVLAEESKKIASKLKTDVEGCPMSNPVNWPAKIIAANSMYRISNTILLGCDEESGGTDDELFDRLSIMISDILAACLTNLARVITTKCHLNALEERRKSVHEAALLLGKAEEILEFLRLPAGLDTEQAAYIEGWRTILLLEKERAPDSITSSSIESTSERDSNRSSIAITLPVETFERLEESCQTISEFSISCNPQHREEVSVSFVAASTVHNG